MRGGGHLWALWPLRACESARRGSRSGTVHARFASSDEGDVLAGREWWERCGEDVQCGHYAGGISGRGGKRKNEGGYMRYAGEGGIVPDYPAGEVGARDEGAGA